MQYLFGTLTVLVGLFVFAPAVFAGGTLELRCDSSIIDKSIKNIYPACNRSGFALPGDVVLLNGYGYTISTKQSPVNIDQSAVLVSGDRRIPISRIYPMPPATSYYMTQNGEFKGNIVVPRETPPGDYELSFKVTQRSCNYSKGVPCIVDVASAHLQVLPTAEKKDLMFLCDKGESGVASSETCQRGSTYWFTAQPLPTQKGQSLYLYLRKNGKYVNYAYMQSEINHLAHTTGGVHVEPGNYEVVLRSILAGVKMGPTDWEKVGPTIRVVAPIQPIKSNPPVAEPVTPVQEDPIQVSSWVDPDFSLQQEYLNPHVPRKIEESFFGGAHFSWGVIWTKGSKFKPAHQTRMYVGTGNGDTFKELAYLQLNNIGAYPDGIPIKRTNNDSEYYVLSSAIPYFVNGKPLPDGKYTLRLENNEIKSSQWYYVVEQPIVIEQIKPLNPKIIIPAKIFQNKQFEVKGMYFPKGSKITSVRFSADTDPISVSQSVTVKQDGTFSLKVTTPARADAIIKYVIDDKDKTIDDFLWTPSATGKIFVGVTALNTQGKEFFASEKTSIPLICDFLATPSIAFTSPPIIDQTGPYMVSFDAQGFTCRDRLAIQFEGLKVNGKTIDKKQSSAFFTSMPSPVTDYRGEVKQLGFGSGWGSKQEIDSDVDYVRMTVTDRKNKSASANIKVIPKYFISLKSINTITWRGFEGGSQALLTLESKELLGKDNPLILKRPYLDLNEKDAEGNTTVDFNVPSDTPAGIYTLRLTQNGHFALAIYIVPKKGQENIPPKKGTPPKEDSLLNPCKGLEGYLLKTCRDSYGLDESKEKQEQLKQDEVANPCTGLEGYMLRQCQKANNITPPKEDVRDEKFIPVSQCSGLEGYMLRQCQAVYGGTQPEPVIPPEEKRQTDNTQGTITSDPCGSMEVGSYFYNQCRQTYPAPQVQKDKYEIVPSSGSQPVVTPPSSPTTPSISPSVKYCDPELPKIWQEGCVQRPIEEIAPAPVQCIPNVPKYSQPNCKEQ